MNFIMDVKSRIDSNDESRSLRDLLKDHIKCEFKDKLDNIKFDFHRYEVQQNGICNVIELNRLKEHLSALDSHGSAICHLENPGRSVGYAVSLYDYYALEDAFAYKLGDLFSSKNKQCERLILGKNQHCQIVTAWTLKAHYCALSQAAARMF